MTHKMMMLVIQIGIILFAARGMRTVFIKLKMPGVLGELAAGILIGPYLLGGIALPGFHEGFFPPGADFAVSVELYGISTIASIILLFMAGLETDLKLFLRFSLAGSVIGTGGVLFSFAAGDLTAVILSELISHHPLNFMSPEALFLGVISTATSVGITAKILSEKRKLDTPEGVSILAGAVIDDVLGIILLAIIIGFTSSQQASGEIHWGEIGRMAAFTIIIWLTFTALGLVFSKQISNALKKLKSNTAIAIMSLGLALIIAGLFEEAGLAMIIGAYITGLSLSGTDISHLIQEKLHPIYEFLVPIFFAVMGMLVDLSAFLRLPVVIFGLVYSLLAILSKLIGCGLPAALFNFNFRGSMRIGAGMIPRGEVALIVAGIGLSSGLISSDIFSVAIIMTLITTLVAPPLLVGMFKNPKSGTKTEIELGNQTLIDFDFPTEELTRFILEKILKAFEEEGFFVHLIDTENAIYQMRKEAVSISMRVEEKMIQFDCQKNDEMMVYTAVYEVAGEVERILKEFQQPMDKKQLGSRLSHASGKIDTHDKAIKIDDILDSRRISYSIKPGAKEEILKSLLALIPDLNDSERELIYNDLMEREKSMSTGMENGIALPHARTEGIKKLICAVGICAEGTDFSSLDGKSTRLFILILSPKGKQAPHLKTMSFFSKILMQEGMVESLINVKNSQAAMKLLRLD